MASKKQDASTSGRTPHRVWLALFGFWLCLLTGVASQWIGPPGMIQAFRLQSLLQEKRVRAEQIHEEMDRLAAESVRLETSRFAVEREIRRTLGYAAADEIIFDFSAGETARRLLVSELEPTPNAAGSRRPGSSFVARR